MDHSNPTFVFWCKLEDKRLNSISSNNLFEARRRAKNLGAIQLFCRGPNGQTKEVSMH